MRLSRFMAKLAFPNLSAVYIHQWEKCYSAELLLCNDEATLPLVSQQ